LQGKGLNAYEALLERDAIENALVVATPGSSPGGSNPGDEGQERRLWIATSAFGLLAMTFHSNAAHSNIPRPSVSLIASLVSRNSTLRELKKRQAATNSGASFRPLWWRAGAALSDDQR
jgi:hypothetical protein